MEERKQRAMYVSGSAVPKHQEQQPIRRRSRRQRPLPGRAMNVIPFSYVIVVGIACICMLYASINYLQVRADAAGLADNLNTIQKKLEDIQVSNSDLEKSIEASSNLSVIYEKATKDYGMVPAGSDQVILFDPVEREYVHQYEDVPE